MTSVQLPPDYSLFSGLDIAPGDRDYVIRDSFTLPVAVQAAGLAAHAHYIGKRLKMTATLPSGEVKTLLSIRDWDFAWQDRYYFDQFISLPAGTRLDGEVHWDNTAENPRNPSNPPIRVTWGEQSKDEMGTVALIGVPHQESDLPKLMGAINGRQFQLMQERTKADPNFQAWLAKLLQQ